MNNYEKLKQRHPLRRDIILVIVLLLLILVAIIFPRFYDLREPVVETEIIYIEDKTDFDGQGPKPDIVGYFLQERDEKHIPPEIIEAALDFEWPVLDTFSLDSLYKYEPKIEGSPPPLSEGCCILIADPLYDNSPEPIGGKKAIDDNIDYPDSARKNGIEGRILVQCFIDTNGVVGKCLIMKGMPGTGLDKAAIDAIKKTLFKPAKQRGKPIGVWIAIPVTFKLD